MQWMNMIIYHVATARIEKDVFQHLINCYMVNENYHKDLKSEFLFSMMSQISRRLSLVVQ